MPHDLASYVDQVAYARSNIQHHIGDFTLTLDPKWNVFSVSHREGKTVPKGLEGRWNGIEDFRRAAEKLLGQDYTIEALTERKAQAERAMSEGRGF